MSIRHSAGAGGERPPTLTALSPSEALEPGRAPPPPRGRKPRRERRQLGPFWRFVNGLFSFALIALVLAGGTGIFLRGQFEQDGPLTASTIVGIKRGEGLATIASRLEDQGIVSDSRLFIASVYYYGASGKLKAGEYEVKKSASLKSVVETLVEGRAISYKVTIPEGLTSLQIIERLRADTSLEGTIETVPPEGSLMPDTYRFTRGTSRQDIVERMQAETRKFWTRMWENRKEGLPFKTIEEAMVMASIVEKETGRAEERPRVASVFINRLRKNMRLQSDPTVIYGIVEGKGTLGRGILRSELDRPTPYNTYTNFGLPPTPICNPGRAAIEATLSPAKTDDIYFVADGSGGHAFAATLKDHNVNVQAWRKFEREMKARAAQQPQATNETPVSAGPGLSEGVADAPTSAPAAPPPAAAAAPAPVRAPPAAAAPVAPAAPSPAPDKSAPAAAAPAQATVEVPLPVRKPKR